METIGTDEDRQNILRRTQALCDYATRNISGVVTTQIARTDLEQAIGVTYHRMILWLEAMARLSEPRYFQTACTGARSIFEHLLDLKKLESNPSLAKAFWEFTEVKRFDIASNIVAFLQKNPSIDQGRFSHQVNCAGNKNRKTRRDSICAANGWKRRPKHWWDASLEDRAREFGVRYEEWYWENYSILSQYLHPGGAGIDALSSAAFDHLYFLFHGYAQEWFIEGTKIVIDAFRISDARPGLKSEFGNLFGTEIE